MGVLQDGWEYKVIQFTDYDDYWIIESELNDHGQDGWELVGTFSSSERTFAKAVLKRSYATRDRIKAILDAGLEAQKAKVKAEKESKDDLPF